MALFTFLVTMAVLAALICAGYRFNMRLYARGALGAHPRRMVYEVEESRSAHRSREASLIQVRDYGLHLARAGVVVVAVLVLIVVVGLVVLVSSVV